MFLLTLALIGGSIWYSKSDTASRDASTNANNKALTANAPQVTDTDYDKDRLKDWEEALWKTDPKSPDTDGDGTMDGEEVASRRNPALRGPDDALTAGADASSPRAAGNSETPQNLTEDFTKTLAKVITPTILGRTSGNFSPKDLAGITGRLPSKENILASAPTVAASDLAISEKNGGGEVKEYFARVFAVYEKRFFKFKPNEDLTIFQRAITGENMSDLAKLDPLIAELEASFREVKNIPVPRGYEKFAVQELNYLLKSKRILEILRGADRDPLMAMAALEPRIDLAAEIVVFHRDTGKFLADKGIAYAREQWGVMFQ